MNYKKYFDPESTQSFPTRTQKRLERGDQRDGSIYVYTEEIILAVNVAIATGRPLLIRGPSGSGKSTLAHNVARHLGWRYYEEIISSSTQAQDLQWRFDTLRRLNDAQVHQLQKRFEPYIEPGMLWWAFDPQSAKRRGAHPHVKNIPHAREPVANPDDERAVVLLDEIDKADPDVPNNLLVPLGSLQFRVRETGFLVKASHSPLVFITTNDERELPNAFLRRCVILMLKSPDESRLVQIAEAHFGPEYSGLYREIAELIQTELEDIKTRQAMPSTAEYLDTIRTCLELNVAPSSATWQEITGITLWKPRSRLGAVG